MSSRLFRKLRHELGMVYDVSAEYQAYRDDGVIVVEGSTTLSCCIQFSRKYFLR